MFHPNSNNSRYIEEAVKLDDIEQDVLAVGTLQPKKLVSVGAQVSGQLKILKISLGDQVHEGQVIAEIDSAPQENEFRSDVAALEALRAQRRSKAATLKQTDRELFRQTQLVSRNITTQAQFDVTEAARDVAKADIESLDAQIAEAEIKVDTAKVNLSYTQISAPISGTVVAVLSNQGQTLNANQTTPSIAIIADLGTMTAKVQISEADINRIVSGQELYFKTLGNSKKKYTSVINQIDPAPESIADDMGPGANSGKKNNSISSAVYYNARFDVDNYDYKLKPGMTVQVSIILSKRSNVLTIPAAALIYDGSENEYKVDVVGPDGRLSEKAVSIGMDNRVVAEITDGLKLGERVVVGKAPESPESSAKF